MSSRWRPVAPAYPEGPALLAPGGTTPPDPPRGTGCRDRVAGDEFAHVPEGPPAVRRVLPVGQGDLRLRGRREAGHEPVRALARGLSRAVVGHEAQTNRTRARPAVFYDRAYVAGAGSRGPGRAGHGTQLAGSARQPVGVLACRRPPAH